MPESTLACMARMARFPILSGSVFAYLVGLSIGNNISGEVDPLSSIFAFIVFLSANLGAQFADEYADVDTDSITRGTWLSGGSGVLPSGDLPRRYALYGAIIMMIPSASLITIAVLIEMLPHRGITSDNGRNRGGLGILDSSFLSRAKRDGRDNQRSPWGSTHSDNRHFITG